MVLLWGSPSDGLSLEFDQWHGYRATTLHEHKKLHLNDCSNTVHDGGKGEEIKGIVEEVPNIGAAVFPDNFFMEAVGA
jgi:hypothetical protein